MWASPTTAPTTHDNHALRSNKKIRLKFASVRKSNKQAQTTQNLPRATHSNAHEMLLQHIMNTACSTRHGTAMHGKARQGTFSVFRNSNIRLWLFRRFSCYFQLFSSIHFIATEAIKIIQILKNVVWLIFCCGCGCCFHGFSKGDWMTIHKRQCTHATSCLFDSQSFEI